MTTLNKNNPKSKETLSQTVNKDPDEAPKLSSGAKHWPFDNGHFAPFNSLRKDIDDIFNQFTDRFGVFSRHASSDQFHMPALDVNETESLYEITAEMPGVAEADIDISITDNILNIRGEKQQSSHNEDGNCRISECSYGVYDRSLSLPFTCEAKSIDAQYENGVLKLSIQKPKELKVKPQKVKIKKAA